MSMLIALCGLLAVSALLTHSATAAMPPPAVHLEQYPAEELFAVTGGTLTARTVEGETRYRWEINAGENSILALRPEHPIFAQLRYFDRLHLEFRVAGGEVSGIGARAIGHVSGVRQSKLHSWNLGVRTVERGVWHTREVGFANPFWLAWDNPDGDGECFFQLEALALAPNTVIELRNLRFVRDLLALKPDVETPVTWPTKTVDDAGNATYTLTYQVHNASGKPTTIRAAVISPHRHFAVTITPASQEVKALRIATFTATATISKADIERTPELYAEPLRVAFTPEHAPDAVSLWQGMLVRPLSPGVRRQVVVAENDLAAIREGVKAGDAGMKRLVGYDDIVRTADEFLGKRLAALPVSNLHVANGYSGHWRPGDFMPEIVNLQSGQRETGTWMAGRIWKEYLGGTGKVCDRLGTAYLFTGEEKYAQKAIELFLLYARQYAEQPWSVQNDAPWNKGAPIQNSSRIAWNNTYGTNWYGKGHSRLLSMIADSPSWTPETRQRVYEGFVLPYATELLKVPGSISNQNDITNHNILLIGLAWDDATMVRAALLSDPGLISRIRDIEPDGFSSEGRPLNYHFAAMQEYMPALTYLVNSGLNVPFEKERLRAALRMPYLRAALTGRVPNTGDCARGYVVGGNGLADHLVPLFPEERWFYDIGGASTLAKKLLVARSDDQPNPQAWRELLSTEPHLFPDAGYAILRSGTTAETQIMATLDYGRSVFHGAMDRNQITLSAFGAIFTHGPGSSYNVGSGGFTRGDDSRLLTFNGGNSIGHNVIIVDKKNQRPAIGELVAWHAQPDPQVVAARVNGIMPGVDHTRALVLTRGLLFILDRVESAESHTYDFVYHNLGVLALGEGWQAAPVPPLAATGNYENIIDPKRLRGTGSVRLTWDLTAQVTSEEKQRKANANEPLTPMALHLWQLPVAGGEVFTGSTGLNNPNTMTMPDFAPSLIHRVTGKTASFVTVLEPVRGGAPRVTAVEAHGETGVTVILANGQRFTVALDAVLANYPVKK